MAKDVTYTRAQIKERENSMRATGLFSEEQIKALLMTMTPRTRTATEGGAKGRASQRDERAAVLKIVYGNHKKDATVKDDDGREWHKINVIEFIDTPHPDTDKPVYPEGANGYGYWTGEGPGSVAAEDNDLKSTLKMERGVGKAKHEHYTIYVLLSELTDEDRAERTKRREKRKGALPPEAGS